MGKNLDPETLKLFFKTLAGAYPEAMDILLIGGSAALLMGGTRATYDIDFEIKPKNQKADLETLFHKTKEIADRTGIGAQFGTSVERWSELSMLDYAKHKKLFHRFGNLTVYVLEPPYWSIGKVARYWDQDIQDMISVFSHEKTDPLALANVWQRVLKESQPSTLLFNLKKQMSHFFKTHGPGIWGKSLPLDKILPLFK